MDFIDVKQSKKDCFLYLDACPMCLSKDYNIKFIFSKDENIYLKECSNCHTYYYNKFYNPKYLNDAYQGYNEKGYGKKYFTKLKFIKKLFSILKKEYLYTPKINPNKKIIDVSCGYGTNLVYYKNKGNFILGTDIDRQIIEKLNLNGFPAIYLDLLKDNVPIKLQKNFDVVFFNFVLEHLSDYNVFSKLTNLLKKNGLLYIVIPNKDSIFAKIFKKYYFMWFFGQHIMFPSKKGLNIVANKYNLKLNKIRYIPDYMELVGSFVFLYKNQITPPSIILIKNKFIIILINLFIVPLLWILSLFKLTGNIQYKFKKTK